MPALNALRAFEAIARHLSFARAAEELHVTPAALSHQIRGLEQEVGVALFHRRTRAIELTEAGRLIYPGIHAGFASLRNAVGQIERARGFDKMKRRGLDQLDDFCRRARQIDQQDEIKRR